MNEGKCSFCKRPENAEGLCDIHDYDNPIINSLSAEERAREIAKDWYTHYHSEGQEKLAEIIAAVLVAYGEEQYDKGRESMLYEVKERHAKRVNEANDEGYRRGIEDAAKEVENIIWKGINLAENIRGLAK